eukprot:7011150-Alexandrium_andersonii.AAC.1
MPSKREMTANGLSSPCDGPWLSGASSRCPVAAAASTGVGEGARGTVGAVEPLLRAALSVDSALLGRFCSARLALANSRFGLELILSPA